MNMQPYRSSFVVFVADSDLSRGRTITQNLSALGYTVEQRVNKDSLFEEIKKNPPHHVVFHYEDEMFFPSKDHQELIAKVKSMLPESHIFIFALPENFSNACGLYEYGVYDVLRWPVEKSIEILHAIDRATETDYHLYRNEQLVEQVGDRAISGAQVDFGRYHVFLKELDRAKDRDSMFELTVRELARRFSSAEALYMRYVPGAGALVVSSFYGFDFLDVNEVGVDLRKNEPGFLEEMLSQPNTLRSLKLFVSTGLQRKDFVAFSHFEKGLVRGLFLIPSSQNDFFSEQSRDDAYSLTVLKSLAAQLEFRDIKSKYERLSIFDDESESLKTEYFLKKIQEEVSRARRILQPVSIVRMSIDGIADLRLEQSQAAIEQFLKSFVQILTKNSRLNDFMGRLADDEFALILPHTEKRGGMIKAERIRRLVESADFSKILAGRKNVTMSGSVSEYPTICTDADGLLRTAEEALNEVRRFGNNRISVAAASPRFIPDFEVKNGNPV